MKNHTKREETKRSIWLVVEVNVGEAISRVLCVRKKQDGSTWSDSFTGGELIFPGGVTHFDSSDNQCAVDLAKRRLGLETKEEEWQVLGCESTDYKLKDYDISAYFLERKIELDDVKLLDNYESYDLIAPRGQNGTVKYGPATERFLQRLAKVQGESNGKFGEEAMKKEFGYERRQKPQPKLPWYKRIFS